ncbi:glycine receptor subunit alpha-2-like isoform X5 [Littorina saxatilis]|uniref:glycine receptor subunit alpha-2-like isoform X5 n=1 Tax=Littorina saxatilis TaxID=31220 RepID=UPI0038B4C49B
MNYSPCLPVMVVALVFFLTDMVDCIGPSSGNQTRLSLLTYLLDTERYDSRVPPEYEKNVPTKITIRVHLLSFDSVSETRMDYSVELFLTQEWRDERLHFANQTDSKWLEVDSKMMNVVWVPDVYFRNEKSGSFHDVTVPNKFMHLYPGGRVVYSVRLSLTLNCRMKLAKYPLDTQVCPMLIQSYTYTTENVVFFWHPTKPMVFDDEMTPQTELPQFSIVANKTDTCETTKDSNEEPTFACIIAKFTLQRDIRYYIIQIYVPSILIVALSWVSFWLDLEAIPARVSLGVLTVLTLNTHGSTIQAALPKVSYIKAIDVWVVSCLIFVFAALLEFAYVNVLARRGDKELGMVQVLATSQLQRDPFQAGCSKNCPISCLSSGKFSPRLTRIFSTSGKAYNCKDVEASTTPANGVNGEMNRHIMLDGNSSSRARARRVDKISRVVFPSCFAFFNLVYWLFYVYGMDNKKND